VMLRTLHWRRAVEGGTADEAVELAEPHP